MLSQWAERGQIPLRPVPSQKSGLIEIEKERNSMNKTTTMFRR